MKYVAISHTCQRCLLDATAICEKQKIERKDLRDESQCFAIKACRKDACLSKIPYGCKKNAYLAAVEIFNILELK